MSFPTLLRVPDIVSGATNNTERRFEENKNHECPVCYNFIVEKNSAKVIVHPSGEPVKYLRLRFSCNLSFVDGVCSDAWATCGEGAEVYWTSVTPYRNLPWYFYLRSGQQIACYGVKTGADSIAFWRVDSKGITLFLNLTSGSEGTDLKESITACEIVEYIAPEGEKAYTSASVFAKMMCDRPNLLNGPIIGMNDWYWAYGNITHDIVKQELDILTEITSGLKHTPYLVIDDGWQKVRIAEGKNRYKGGPWVSGEKFGDIEKTAEMIRNKGTKPGIWFRALMTNKNEYNEALLREYDNGYVLDPTHPYTVEKIISDISRLRGYGFDYLKHDFSTHDIFGGYLNNFLDGADLTKDSGVFYDNTKTTAMILKNFYNTIQTASDGAVVMGCAVIGHLSAGIHQAIRTGDDTSGLAWEATLRNGGNAFMRLPQNKAFHTVDPDCAAFTDKVPFEENLEFLKLCAVCNTVTMASITPGLLSKKQLDKIADAFKMADKDVDNDVFVENFEKVTIPETFIINGEKKEFEWYKFTNGTRIRID